MSGCQDRSVRRRNVPPEPSVFSSTRRIDSRGKKTVPRYRVLVAEDEAITALALEQTLSGHGFDVCGLAATGAEARAVAERTRPAVAVIDMRLKDGVTGHVVARDLQARLGIPVILMSAHADANTAHELGAAGFLPKPFSDRDLLRAIEKVLGVEAAVES